MSCLNCIHDVGEYNIVKYENVIKFIKSRDFCPLVVVFEATLIM